jgi:hypothetical protein
MNLRRGISAIGLAFGVIVPLQAATPSSAAAPRVSRAVRHDTSPALRDIPGKPVLPSASREISVPRLPSRLASKPKPAGREDPVRQRDFGLAAPTAPSLIFDGQSDDENAAVLGFRVVPPDTNGDVGKNDYVQFINLIFSVYDKKSSARTFGPVPGNIFWTGFGGACETHNDGDPIVLYDAQADRWMVSQFAIAADGHQCVAVSKTGDPAGAYHRYDFVVSPNAFNDYPKLGVWPDAYYMSANQYSSAGFDGVIAVAFERSKMLAGQPAQMVEFGPLPCADECPFTLQPMHLNGPEPSAGTANTYVMPWDDQYFGTGTKPDGYRLWDFHVDWTTPSASSFTALPQLDTAPFDANLCNALVHCIPQPPPGERIDALGPWSMYPAQVNFFRGHASIVLNHSVDVDGHNLAGVRWVELRNTGGVWSVFQNSTYAPADGNHRWLGSIAMDRSGNIALGFSVSGPTTMPSIRYVTRTPGDPPGTFSGAETDLVIGSGVQQASFGRWGDYSRMSVDSKDGCTFWYTQEYYANTGTFDFKTSIASFKVPGCH